jgi:hypothetical protein
MLMEITMLASGKMEQQTDTVFLLIRKGAQCMMETGKMINMMAMEQKHGIIIL